MNQNYYDSYKILDISRRIEWLVSFFHNLKSYLHLVTSILLEFECMCYCAFADLSEEQISITAR